MRKLLAYYRNGNYTVRLFDDGTKVKRTDDDGFRAEFPDSIDLKITDYCDLGCPMCHERSSRDGIAGALTEKFLYTLHPGTELAIGGGDPLSHEGLIPFLESMREQGVVCNLTVNGAHLLQKRPMVESLLARGLVHGLGISLRTYDSEAVRFAEQHENSVLHLINGVFEDYSPLFGRGLKILMLGYKQFGRGVEFYDARIEGNMKKTKEIMPTFVDKFACVSFDNLAITQLGVRDMLSDEDFSRIYMGEDGEASMYVDLPRREFAQSSVSHERYPLLGNIKEMFDIIKNKKGDTVCL